MKSDSTKAKHLKVIEIYDRIVEESGKYAPYLSKSYFITNTIYECNHCGIKKVTRSVVYDALRDYSELKKLKPFIE